MAKKQNKVFVYARNYVMLFIGAILYAAGLEVFLIPNNVIDGGVVGVSVMLSHLTGVSLSVFIVVLNIPFLYLGYQQIGKTFTVSTLFSLLSLAYWLSVFTPIPVITHDLFLATVFGGIIMGIGVGIIIRYGGSLDGSEIVAIIMDKRTSLSVGEIIMVINLFILGAAGLVFGWDKAMYSLIAYYIASKVIDTVVEGIDESKAVLIVSDYPEQIAEALMARLGRGVTVLHGEGGYTGEPKKVLYSVVTRLEVAKLKTIVQEQDEHAFVTINEVHDVMGGRVKKKAIH